MQIINGSLALLLVCAVTPSCSRSKSEKPVAQPPEVPSSGTMKFSDGVEVNIDQMKGDAACIRLVEQLKDRSEIKNPGDAVKGVRIEIQDDKEQKNTFYCMM